MSSNPLLLLPLTLLLLSLSALADVDPQDESGDRLRSTQAAPHSDGVDSSRETLENHDSSAAENPAHGFKVMSTLKSSNPQEVQSTESSAPETPASDLASPDTSR